jgi:carbonic anhydrase
MRLKEKAMRRLEMVGMVLCGLTLGAALPVCAQQTADSWAYEGKNGPLNWNRLDPANKACSSGKEQSPIDIRGAKVNKNLKPIEFHYVSGSMTLTNTGHTIEIAPPAGSYIIADGTRYDLQVIHFHHPGEEAVKGRLPDMSIHLIHKSADGKFAVLAVRLNEGNGNAILAGLWPHLPKKVGASEKVSEELSPAGLLPANKAYWTYTGSLSEPPCTEGVQWFVFEQQGELSRDQLKTFGYLYKINSRKIQETHGRKIQATEY